MPPKIDIAALHRAAESGNLDAQLCLGSAYFQGLDVPRDDAQAAAWSRKAAEQGSAHAQFQLGARYEVGRSVVPQDLVYAHFYYSLAASRATRITKALNERARDRVTAKMTQQQIAEAQKLAREWVAAFEQRQKKQ